jgi:hypothetical protein
MDFPGDFPQVNLTMWENFGPRDFQQPLITNGLQIICEVLRGNLHPLVQGDGVPVKRGTGGTERE